MKKYNKNGFTLIELLAVIVIIMILMGLLMPALFGTKKQAKNKQSKAECMTIETAIVSYKTDRRKWPACAGDADDGDNGSSSDKTYSSTGDKPNAYIIKELTRPDPPYLDIGDFKTDSSGNVLDPWGDEYIIKIDTDYDGYWKKDNDNNPDNDIPMPEGVKVVSETYPTK